MRAAELTSTGWLTPGEVAVILRSAYDPAAAPALERASAMALREAERVVRVVQTDDAALLYSLLERVASIEAQERVSVEQLRLDKARAIADLGVVAIKLLSAACASSGATDAASCWRIFWNIRWSNFSNWLK